MKPIRYGMIGGGQGAFIGGVHRTAAAIAGNWQLVAGAFSSTAEKSKASGEEIGVPADRVYGSWAEMLERESALAADQRIEAVSIVTPNHMHAPPGDRRDGSGLRCDHRQAAGRQPCQCAGDCRRGSANRAQHRRDPYLHRLSAGQAGARTGLSQAASSAKFAGSWSNTHRTG